MANCIGPSLVDKNSESFFDLWSKQSVITPTVGRIDITVHQMSEGNLDITVFHNAKGQGEKAPEAVAKMVKGEPVEPVYRVPFELVTKANEAEYASK